ncbi:hypothetical protein MNBD_GAMMA26-827 [hydrothermal vent metagenome]|uniref:Uncharacterized protein n=1 Tax=hydrothermal vent metagenome TaxID=652676 RepID=A0A3B1B6X1_9ZZZZ
MTTRKRVTKSVTEHDPLAIAEPEQLEDASEPEIKTAVAGADQADTFTFGDSLTIGEVADLQQRLMAVFNASGVIKLDGGDIQQTDGAGMQLLAAFVKEAVKMHVAFEWNNTSPALRDGAAQLGLAELLQLGEANAAA